VPMVSVTANIFLSPRVTFSERPNEIRIACVSLVEREKSSYQTSFGMFLVLQISSSFFLTIIPHPD